MSIEVLSRVSNRLSSRVAGEVRATMARFSLQQADLATVLDVSQAHASRKLRCVTPFTLDELEIVADWFGTTPMYFLGDVSQPRPRDPGRGRHSYTARDSNPEPAD